MAYENRFFQELARVLEDKHQITAEEEGWRLKLSRDGDICYVTDDGYVNTLKGEETKSMRSLREAVHREIPDAWELVRNMEHAPPLVAAHLDPEDNWRLLADFGGVVMAASDLGEYGYKMVTWKWDSQRKGVELGDYENHTFSQLKEDFAKRSGLVALPVNHQKAAALYHTLKERLEEPHLLSPKEYGELLQLKGEMEHQVNGIQTAASERFHHPEAYWFETDLRGVVEHGKLNLADSLRTRQIEETGKYVILYKGLIIGADGVYVFDDESDMNIYLNRFGLHSQDGVIDDMPPALQRQEMG